MRAQIMAHGASVAGTTLAGCSPKVSSSSSASASGQATGTAQATWRTPPAEIKDFASEVDCEVVVVGHGYAGLTACRELAEEGHKVVLIEKQDEENYAAVGNEFTALNASILKERGVPEMVALNTLLTIRLKAWRIKWA